MYAEILLLSCYSVTNNSNNSYDISELFFHAAKQLIKMAAKKEKGSADEVT